MRCATAARCVGADGAFRHGPQQRLRLTEPGDGAALVVAAANGGRREPVDLLPERGAEQLQQHLPSHARQLPRIDRAPSRWRAQRRIPVVGSRRRRLRHAARPPPRARCRGARGCADRRAPHGAASSARTRPGGPGRRTRRLCRRRPDRMDPRSPRAGAARPGPTARRSAVGRPRSPGPAASAHPPRSRARPTRHPGRAAPARPGYAGRS